jgi:hypothetical protein
MAGIAAGCAVTGIAEPVAAGGGVAEVVGAAEAAEVVAAGADRPLTGELWALAFRARAFLLHDGSKSCRPCPSWGWTLGLIDCANLRLAPSSPGHDEGCNFGWEMCVDP